MITIPSQCKLCLNFDKEESLCRIHEQLPGEYGRENVKDCPSFLENSPKNADDLSFLMKYMDEEPQAIIEQRINDAVDKLLSEYETKYKVLIVGIARRKIKSIIKMVDIVDVILDRLGEEQVLSGMAPNQAIRLLSELNHSMNNDLAFIMKLVNPETKLIDLQMWIDNRSVNVTTGASPATEMKAEEILNLSTTSRDKIREAFDALLHQINNDGDEVIEVLPEEGVDDEG